ncbi:hypothetical protein VA7868_00669 [Vibrio aerogenes CECT 7868]|uniref:Uncharacterized protein n=1 Tax=Vibrio aerogenes CECT 7868 TaxID=1216006 RepID=A0A1M5WBU4_9VIBR|nr:hypothetical protein VA7868_00669 [Vibrio aerogenes CECT 7868]
MLNHVILYGPGKLGGKEAARKSGNVLKSKASIIELNIIR